MDTEKRQRVSARLEREARKAQRPAGVIISSSVPDWLAETIDDEMKTHGVSRSSVICAALIEVFGPAPDARPSA